MTEYRQDDRTEGYCPQCGAALSAMTTGMSGFCERHGWQYADYRQARAEADAAYAAREDTIQDTADEIARRLSSETGLDIAFTSEPIVRPSDRDPGDETDSPNLTPGVMTGKENDR